ncbi:MAG: class II aldolase/adducin family protein [Gammaproteobacteria bacterium]|nr:class II aldolase/adducin family protein [Gammaproteobacteria bacterium]
MQPRHTELREGVISTCVEMNNLGINQGTSGNVSARLEDCFLITPSGIPYEDLETDHIVEMDMDGRYDDAVKPSSEWKMHLAIYHRFAQAQAIIHTHGVFCTALACQRTNIPAFHYMVAVAGGNDIPCADYATFGTQMLADNMLAALVGRRACLLANHGMICYGENLPNTLRLAVEVETLAKQYWHTRQLGEPVLLSDKELDRVRGLFAGYGQESSKAGER